MLILLTSTAAEKTDQKITVADSSSQSTSGPSRPTTVSVRSEKDEAEEWPVREMIAILGLGLVESGQMCTFVITTITLIVGRGFDI